MVKNPTWQQQLADVISDPQTLCDILGLDIQHIVSSNAATAQFPLRVPRAFVSRMERGNPDDPLLQQVLPLGVEMQALPGYSTDPLLESNQSPTQGVLHKYHGRVLLTLTGSCAIHCRYCFRRHYPYAQQVPGFSQWQAALDYILADTSIEEVIFSGGDPLIIKDDLLAELITKLENIPHLKRLRFHTRLPVVIPNRITDSFVNRLKKSRLKVIIVLHSNHANELDETVATAIKKCESFTMLNQTVLLKGINDNAQILINLSKRLFELNILPYYLHLLDPVSGAAHFDISESEAKILHQEMLLQLSGYLVPKLVREVPGMGSKQLVI